MLLANSVLAAPRCSCYTDDEPILGSTPVLRHPWLHLSQLSAVLVDHRRCLLEKLLIKAVLRRLLKCGAIDLLLYKLLLKRLKPIMITTLKVHKCLASVVVSAVMDGVAPESG